MNQIADHYRHRVETSESTDFLAQVGHTLNGQAVAPAHVEAMKQQIVDVLDLAEGDHLLDLGCGNGVFTVDLVRITGSGLGLDLSPSLIELARTHHSTVGLDYVAVDLKALAANPAGLDKRFNKVLMHAALQHFQPHGFGALLDSVLDRCEPECTLFFALVPDSSKRWTFYNTLERRVRYVWERFRGRHLFGYWWSPRYVEQACRERDLEINFPPVPQILDSARYRFGIKIRRTDPQ
ncbi:class I SAM-dependent methyltransferase [Maricaulis sp.]|uniref:class I SAM-dependent methyltransferase n=1 Tax=Maricaulis sp. TaxID=1486257 RepID=UPI002627710F|nr:class I SAM-dependent methyltransferase [Maricaulis sp.]